MMERTALAAAFLATPGVFAEELTQTPRVGEGPFYPDKMPLDTDNDLLLVNDAVTPAVGEITHLSGKVLSSSGAPLRNAFVEIWQVDNKGAYIHSRSANSRERDANFQGYGRFLTDSEGRYYFRTIKPVAYPGRTPHIHFGVSKGGKRIFTTQMLINGHPQNKSDGLLRSVRDPKALATLMVDFKKMADSKLGELSANFDMVLGQTLEELDDGTLGQLGKPEFGQRGQFQGRRPR